MSPTPLGDLPYVIEEREYEGGRIGKKVECYRQLPVLGNKGKMF